MPGGRERSHTCRFCVLLTMVSLHVVCCRAAGGPPPLATRVPLVPRVPRVPRDGAGHSNLLRTTCRSTRPTERDNRRLNRPAVAGQPLGGGAAPSTSRRQEPTTDISI